MLFLDAKAIVGARGHDVTPLQRVIIAIQACVLVLHLDLAFYDGFENVIVYPGEFVPDWEWEDDAGRKSTTIARKLRDVEALPENEADRLLTGEASGNLLEGEVASPPPEAPKD